MTAQREPHGGQPGSRVATAPDAEQSSRLTVTIDGTTLRGVAVDLRSWSIDAEDAAAAIRGRTGTCTVACPHPGSLFDAVGVVEPSLNVSLRRVLAAVARRRGYRADVVDELRSVSAELATLSPPDCDRSEQRRQVAAAGTDEAKLAERVATIRGELQARRDAGVDVSATEKRLSDAVAALTDARTERLSAEQALDRAREDSRPPRDRRDRRLRLQDRKRNLERAIRRELADAVYNEFTAAVWRVPGESDPGRSVVEYEGDGVTAALAVLRMLRTATPAVLAVDRFDGPERAAHELGVPILRV
ncbi:hypothetical protein [Natranaeroarchaeum aerophilus]|uniref:Uncharacterized protein n=1 Tax=Natranaeroarchaeum aerophilus TaxID=2917711 RepID=A0AAE3FLL1_9EURY|nr:hypothetical protein [Natranaeroarchaeum aerophilus]MCL9812167.1 hypothetical protein [Natranaeroarchaeum aerophilus]